LIVCIVVVLKYVWSEWCVGGSCIEVWRGKWG
jgi:hypothetical protein